jgi:hypothetical protein
MVGAGTVSAICIIAFNRLEPYTCLCKLRRRFRLELYVRLIQERGKKDSNEPTIHQTRIRDFRPTPKNQVRF